MIYRAEQEFQTEAVFEVGGSVCEALKHLICVFRIAAIIILEVLHTMSNYWLLTFLTMVVVNSRGFDF